MTEEIISSDYLVIGAGAMGMAFVDTMLTDSKATITIVDRYHQPGGHWTTAYPFVRLHQPSNFYGVNSRALGMDTIDKEGWNEGLFELASASELCAYFDQVMHQTFLPSGRVAYYPKCEYTGNGRFRSMVTGKTYRTTESTCIVDATYMKVKVPSMGPPDYGIGEGVKLVTPNTMPLESRPYSNYTVVGAGKTGIDACLWLLGIGIQPSAISWIMPRDQWLVDRRFHQAGDIFAEWRHAIIPNQAKAIHAATTADDLLQQLSEAGQLMRLSENVWPTMFRCATVSRKEFEALKQIENVIRLGRVLQIDQTKVTLERGSYAPDRDTLWIDCTADGLAKVDAVPVFQKNLIILQSVRYCQQVFSAAFIAHLEATYPDTQTKNYLSRPIPHPNHGIDWIAVSLLNSQNTMRLSEYPETLKWLANSRLDWFRHMASPLPKIPEERKAVLERMKEVRMKNCSKLESLIDTMRPEDAARVRKQVYHNPAAPQQASML
ncbi:hypothetical protein CKM354_000382400 [Cercospora kikuchii]|uniref:NAD(P)/FAD-dependent oxidoreductase n=1 Tax=Cercospora kikuchii TaxID=84275 RepID=A0A9P3CCM7_9PEZI|nr:uncharacterized protein CKM354_000382400 [Cercospora kikuchii]GIZ40489.1 hypothetical protein CKM354_000382400 [Cercospora kikuchii]